jgi:hypothetical protein
MRIRAPEALQTQTPSATQRSPHEEAASRWLGFNARASSANETDLIPEVPVQEARLGLRRFP